MIDFKLSDYIHNIHYPNTSYLMTKHKARFQSLNPGLEVIKLFLCSTQLSMKFLLLINVKMPTIVGILPFMNAKTSILGLSESKKKSRIS